MDVSPERDASELEHQDQRCRARPRIRVPSDFISGPRSACDLGVLTLAVLGALSGCYGPESERLACGDVLAPGNVEFGRLVALVRDPAKGCLLGACHAGDTQAQGLRLDTADLVFEEMSTRADDMYAVLSSGRMPEGGTPWSDDDLRLFRSWYCSGAFPR
jgi:hypothetical protein